MSEHDSQVALFDMIDLHSERYPQLKNIFSIPNGGARTSMTGARMKAEGCRAGVPDIFVASTTTWYGAGRGHGLFLEMKHGRNKPDAAQDEWLGRLREAGYSVAVCWSWGEAWKAICDYLGIEPPAR